LRPTAFFDDGFFIPSVNDFTLLNRFLNNSVERIVDALMPEGERMGGRGSADILLFEAFRLDRSSRGLFRVDQAGIPAPIPIGSRALDLLALLVERHGELVSKDAIMDAVWPGTAVEEGNLTVQISALRRILDRNRAHGSCIQTVPGRGYRFVAPMTHSEPKAAVGAFSCPDNGSGRPNAEDDEVQNPDASRRIGDLPSVSEPRAWHPRWGIMTTVIGVLGLIATAVITLSWHSPWSTAARPPPRLSIVVLPFANLGDDREEQYFVDGINQDLTTDLSLIADMFVISRNTAFTYKDKPVVAKQIARELGVRYVLEGSVRRSGDRVRINAQLVDADTDAQVWAERFDRDMGDVFTLQDEITRRIANALNLELLAVEAARPTDHPDVLDCIFRGRAALAKGPSSENLAEAIGLFERALELDPRSVEAQSQLALTLTSRVFNEMTDSPAADIKRSEGLVGQALAISPHSPAVHYAKGQVLRAQRRCEEAVPEYEIAIGSFHNQASALAYLAWCKLSIGSIEETIPLEEEAIRLSPHDSHIFNRYGAIGLVHLLQSRTEEAIVWFEKARSANPGSQYPHAWLAGAYALKGELDHAAAELGEARRLSTDGRSFAVARLRSGPFGVPAVRELYETTYFAGLRKAGLLEE
jgi:TolB-like protein/DNA-binding winged helix-turn-helix (wHTH) protein